jgi:predicted transcriptional regulator
VAESSEPASLAEVTAEIVAAYVSHNKIALADVPALITSVAGQMARIGTEVEPPAEAKPEPAVAVRRSVHQDRLICLVCGKAQKVLKRHLAVKHELTPGQYRARFELRPDYPMIAPAYAQQRREVALKLGLGRPKPVRRGRPGRPPGRPRSAASSQPAASDAGA